MKTNKKVVAIVAIVALVAILGICLCACNAESYTKKLEKKDYVVTDMTTTVNAAATLAGAGEVEFALMAAKGANMVNIAKYKKSADAKTAFENSKKQAGDNWKKLVYRSGKLVIVASTEQALKDAK